MTQRKRKKGQKKKQQRQLLNIRIVYGHRDQAKNGRTSDYYRG